MAEIKEGKSVISDSMDKLHRTKDGITCCGGLMKMIMHIDGKDFYEFQYQCECGNLISVCTEREEEDIWE